MDIRDLNGRLAVITGGSSGIGYAIAERLARRGADLLLVARDEAKLADAAATLDEIGSGDVQVVSADVTREADIQRVAERVGAMAPAADIVINSAGIVSAGLLHEVPLAEWDRLHNINVRGLVQVLQALIPDMITAHGQDGRQRQIVNIGSAAGFSGVPGMAAYGATKAAVIALSESLRLELAGQGIGVTAICPGFVQTPIAETVQLFGRMNNPKTEKVIRRMFALGNLSPERVADITLQAMARNRGFVAIGREASAGHLLKRLSPNLFARVVARTTRI